MQILTQVTLHPGFVHPWLTMWHKMVQGLLNNELERMWKAAGVA
jgi:hypothetical protein